MNAIKTINPLIKLPVETKEYCVLDAIKDNGKVIIPVSHTLYCYQTMKILYLEAYANYTNLVLTTGERHCISKTMKEVMTYLPENLFFRIHKSYVVNAQHISMIELSKSNQVTLTGDIKLPVSRERKEMFSKYFG